MELANFLQNNLMFNRERAEEMYQSNPSFNALVSLIQILQALVNQANDSILESELVEEAQAVIEFVSELTRLHTELLSQVQAVEPILITAMAHDLAKIFIEEQKNEESKETGQG